MQATVNKNKFHFALPAWMILTIIAAFAALLLALTNMATRDIIANRALQAKQEAMSSLLPQADSFDPSLYVEGGVLDSFDVAKNGNETIGYVAQITKSGYGGPIEIIVAMDNNLSVQGISIGGPEFAETAGLGSKVKESKFTDQYQNKEYPIVLNKDIDQISGATISSTAVNQGVNEAVEAAKNILN